MSKAEPTGDNGYVREPDRDYEGLKDLNTKQVAVIKKIEYTFQDLNKTFILASSFFDTKKGMDSFCKPIFVGI